ncbi:cytochrome P450 3A17 protein [Rutstroemia sp. NJR-2017a WRK4]|nr:cytochrome P450 3A17 protein [Rutstroemia sp. NJR-2017a WRK4]
MSSSIPLQQFYPKHPVTLVDLGNVLALLFIAALCYRVGLVVYRLFFHPLRAFPGPKLWAITDLPYTYTSDICGTSTHKIAEFHKKYGPAVRVGPDRLALDGIIGWPEVYARRTGGNAEYEKAPRFFARGTEQAIISSPRDPHRRQRRQLGHAFSDAAMHEQEGIIMRYVHLLVDRVQEHVDSGKALNIVQWLNFITFDIIGDMTYGESFGSLESSNYHPWVLSIFEGIRADSFIRACRNYPTLGPLVEKLAGSTKGKENDELAITKGKVRMDLGIEPNGRRDFMSYMLKPTRDGDPGLSVIEALSNCPLLVAAGSETTATALSGFFFYVNRTPRVKALVMNEIRNAFKAESEIDMVSTNNLEYLHATLEETLRAYPPVATTPPRVSPGAEIDGKYVPQGTVIHVSQWVTFRNPEHFLEPDSFCPERWLKNTHPLYESKFDNDNRDVFKPFSYGPRDCIGKNLAYVEMRLIVSHLLYRFDFEVLPGQDDWHATQNTYVVWEKGPLYIKFSARGR